MAYAMLCDRCGHVENLKAPDSLSITSSGLPGNLPPGWRSVGFTWFDPELKWQGKQYALCRGCALTVHAEITGCDPCR